MLSKFCMLLNYRRYFGAMDDHLFSIDSFPVWILIPSFIASIYKESLKKKNGELSIFKHNVEGYYGLYILVMTIVLLITGGFWIDMVK